MFDKANNRKVGSVVVKFCEFPDSGSVFVKTATSKLKFIVESIDLDDHKGSERA
jgi:hypothetical protein